MLENYSNERVRDGTSQIGLDCCDLVGFYGVLGALRLDNCNRIYGGITRYNRCKYLIGSYRIATVPEPNSSQLTSLKATRFDSPANNVGPWRLDDPKTI